MALLRLGVAILVFFWFVHGVLIESLAQVIISAFALMACAIPWEQE